MFYPFTVCAHCSRCCRRIQWCSEVRNAEGATVHQRVTLTHHAVPAIVEHDPDYGQSVLDGGVHLEAMHRERAVTD
jgi:hypothetical protein